MRMLLYIVLAVAALAVAGFFVFAFLLTGGFDRWTAERETAARGFEATEPHAAPGFKKLLIPKGWRRDTYHEIFDRPGESAKSGAPREDVALNGPDEAMLHLALGQFSHAGGTAFSANATLYTRLEGAMAWTVADGLYGTGRDDDTKWEAAEGPTDLETYIPKNAAPQDKGVQLLMYDPRIRTRIHVRTTADIYSQAQAIALAHSILKSIVLDDAALAAARDALFMRAATDEAAATKMLAKAQTILGLPYPLDIGLTDAGGGTFLLVTKEWRKTAYEWRLAAYVRLGEVPLSGRTPEATAAALELVAEKISALARPSERERSMGVGQAELLAIWRKDDKLTMYNLEIGRDIGDYPLNSEMPIAIDKSLPADALALYRTSEFVLTETERLEPWFRETKTIQDAARNGDAPWRPKAPAQPAQGTAKSP